MGTGGGYGGQMVSGGGMGMGTGMMPGMGYPGMAGMSGNGDSGQMGSGGGMGMGTETTLGMGDPGMGGMPGGPGSVDSRNGMSEMGGYGMYRMAGQDASHAGPATSLGRGYGAGLER